jgi:acyl carrier protein
MENGKADMMKLKEFTPVKTAAAPEIKLTNKTELEIYSLWCEVLKKENIPQHLSIFEAGGNSIAIVLLHQKLQTAFNINFSLIELFRNPTIPQQAKLVQHSTGKETTTVTKAMSKGASRRNLRTNRLN